MNKDVKDAIEALKLDIHKVRLEALATRVGFMALVRSHPNRQQLVADFYKGSEQAIATAVSRIYPDELVNHLRDEIEAIREDLRRISYGGRQ